MSSNQSSSERMPWIAAYPPGMVQTIDTNRYENVMDLVDQATAQRKHDVAFVCSDVAMTFGELSERANALANYLGNVAGVERGDRVAVMLPNLLEFPICLLGILRAGAVQVSVNPQYTPREVRHQLQNSGARVLVVFSSAMRIANEALVGTAVEKILLVGGPPDEHATEISPINFDAALSLGSAIHGWKHPKISHEDLALLQYTGGTTGVSKGAQLTHANIVANILQIRAMLCGAIDDGKETILTALPLFHIFALTVNCLTFLTFGSRNVLLTNPRDSASLIAAFVNHKITIVTGVNTLFAGLLAMPTLQEFDYSPIKLALGGGTAVLRKVSDAWHARTGSHILEGYGLSETAPVVTLNSYANPNFSASIGVPVPSTIVIIADEEGTPLATGIEGEICIKGPQVMRGYWLDPETSAAAFTKDGYFRSGDIGVMDEHGFIRICDRKKDMVIVSGFNVYPNEVEDVIASFPGVVECAVTGVPDAKTGEAVRAIVVRKDSSLAKVEILAHCRAHLAAYKVPKSVTFVSELPKSSVGKILRRELRSINNTPGFAKEGEDR